MMYRILYIYNTGNVVFSIKKCFNFCFLLHNITLLLNLFKLIIYIIYKHTIKYMEWNDKTLQLINNWHKFNSYKIFIYTVTHCLGIWFSKKQKSECPETWRSTQKNLHKIYIKISSNILVYVHIKKLLFQKWWIFSYNFG